jgi:drug/metabolite transporter (DMT)-like permease
MYLVIAAIMQAIAMALFKIAADNGREKARRNGLLRGGAAVIFAISFPIYMKGLSALSLGVVQPVYSATMFLATIIIAALLLKERVALRQVMGGIVIVFGIVIVLL